MPKQGTWNVPSVLCSMAVWRLPASELFKELSWVQKGGSVDNSGKAAMCKKGSEQVGFRCG